MRHLLATALATFALVTGVSSQANTAGDKGPTTASIEGVYLLYHWGDQDGKPVAKMAITARDAKSFSVRGLDQTWSGEGSIDGNTGYFNWVFADGKKGKTTFTHNLDGTLKGEVRGEVGDWTYLARRPKKAD
jgi:hypothetical protein